MVISLQIGKSLSKGCPGKNVRPVLGRALMEYPLLAAKNSRHIKKMFMSTDSEDIAKVAAGYGAAFVRRPESLSKIDTLTEHVLIDALRVIREDYKISPSIICIFFSNAPMIPKGYVDKAIEILDKSPELDSVFSVCEYNMFTPLRAKKLNSDGTLRNFINIEEFGDIKNANRDAGGDCYFADLNIQVIRAQCIDNLWSYPPPIRWMGNHCFGLKLEQGFDIDAEWQFPVAEHWLKQQGFSADLNPYDC